MRLDSCQRELYQAREAAKRAEDQLQRAEQHFHEQLAGARARNVTPPNGARTDSEFDGRNNYDRYEEPGFMGKLAWYLFGEQEPVAESEGVVVEVEPPAMREQEELEPEC